jgi:hypothetical protein
VFHLRVSMRARLVVTVFAVACLLGSAMPAVASAAPYSDLERFALSLVNCTRTGGWVRADGTCKGRGSGHYSTYRKPLSLHSGISRKVSRGYAAKLAAADACRHDLGGSSILRRFRNGGYSQTPYGESLGCSSGWSTRQMVIRTHRMMQSERSYNGWHWRNMKDRDFTRVGIGIARNGKESRVVYDFYGG